MLFCRLKKVLVVANESGCSINQIAVMQYESGDVSLATIHPDLQDNFYVLSGEMEVVVVGETNNSKAGDFFLFKFILMMKWQSESIINSESLRCGISSMPNLKHTFMLVSNRRFHQKNTRSGLRMARLQMYQLCTQFTKGDVFYLPAGRVHAICSGILITEVQQSSDVTNRIFDYNRLGLDGKPRELHTEQAARVIDYEVYSEYKTEHREELDTAFSIKIVETTKPFYCNMVKYDSFFILMALNSDCKVRVRSTGDEVIILEVYSCLIPAAVTDYELIPMQGYTKVLESFTNNKKSIGRIISDFFHQN